MNKLRVLSALSAEEIQVLVEGFYEFLRVNKLPLVGITFTAVSPQSYQTIYNAFITYEEAKKGK